MKKLSKILALVLALMMVITAFGACKKVEDVPAAKVSEEKEVKQTKKLTDEEQIEENVENFYESMLSFDLDKMEKYAKPDSDIAQQVLENAGYEDMASTFEMLGLSKEESDEIIEMVFENIKYEVSDIKVDGDTAEVIIKLSSPDFNLMNEKTSQYEDVTLELLSKELGFKSAEDFQAAAQSGAITEDEAMEAMGKVFAEIMKMAVEDIKDEPYIESTEKATLEKIDDVWYIAG